MKAYTLNNYYDGKPAVLGNKKEIKDLAYFPSSKSAYKFAGVVDDNLEPFQLTHLYLKEETEENDTTRNTIT